MTSGLATTFASILLAVCIATSATAHASDAAAAVAVIAEIEADKAKLEAYCAASKALLAATTPEQTEAMAEKFDVTVRGFGEKFATALDLHYELDDTSADGQAMVAQFQKLDAMCGSAP